MTNISSRKNEKKEWLNGVIFVFLFVLQQIMNFTYRPFNLVTPYWLLIIFLFFIVGFSLPLKRYVGKTVFFFAIVCSLFSMLTIINGNSIGLIVCDMLFMFFGFWGYVFIVERKIKLIVFDILLILLYIYFYFKYFQFSEDFRGYMNSDLFGFASSNVIAMSLNIVTYVYLLISYVYKANNKTKLIVFSSINLVLIFYQGSRAGLLVAILILILVFFHTNKKKKIFAKVSLYIGISLILLYAIYQYSPTIMSFMEEHHMGVNSYEEDVRSLSLAEFFAQMDSRKFLLGFPHGYIFIYDINRTFNAFFDFWKTYGFIPFVFMTILFVRRIVRHKDYEIPLIMFLPFVAYSLFESLWGGTFWDTLLFLMLFYTNKTDEKIQAIN